MQQRKSSVNELDDFPTPPWATRAAMEILFKYYANYTDSVWDPTCNRGYMVKVLRERFHGDIYASDIAQYGQNDIFDFSRPTLIPDVDWIVTNPPFKLAELFILHGIFTANKGVMCILRTNFIDTVGRYNRLFKNTPPNIIAQHAERVPMVKGRYDPKAKTATAYCWMIWAKHARHREPLMWIEPCRKRLERDDDTRIV